MKRIPVNSSNIKSVGYAPQAGVLDIEFQSGKVYRYYDVPQGYYDDLMRSESVGRYYNAYIKGRYESRDVTGEQPDLDKLIGAMQMALHDLEQQDYAPYTLDDEDHPLHASAQALREALREVGVEPDPVERTVTHIIRHFDWDRVLVVMRVLDWRWGNGEQSHLPALHELQATAAKLLRGVAQDPEHRPNGSGGFRVQFDEHGQLELIFVVTGYVEGLA